MWLLLIFGLNLLCASPQGDIPPHKPIIKNYTAPGNMNALVDDAQIEDYHLLVQFTVKSDSLLDLIHTQFPHGEFLKGPATYQRIMSLPQYSELESLISPQHIMVVDDDYAAPHQRSFWVQVHEGSETHGTWTDDEAIAYDCMCLDGASDCVRLGWYSWYNPFDYWGEAWYAYDPPYYQEIEEIRITVRGAQCDDLPLSSESYMGMRNNDGGWGHDFQLSIDYTDNEFIVPTDVWSDGMLMPQMGSEDNYVIDNVKLEFYYSCNGPEWSPANLLASDDQSCTYIDVNWELSPSDASGQRLYRDDELIASLDATTTTFQDWLATPGTTHIYCIESYNECGESAQICNPGSLQAAPQAVDNLWASDGEFDDRVVVNWAENANTESYKIYRDGTWMGIQNTNQTTYTDFIIDFGVSYEYCIEAINECGNSQWSCDTGFSDTTPGDVNEDGEVNVLDVVVVVNVILLEEALTEYIQWAADLNFDGDINVMDIVLLVNQILG
jgi:hypothetical protein